MINQLPSPKTTPKRTQRGRGPGSGHGSHTSGRGMKGQKSRSGYKKPRPGFEGGQLPLSRRLPRLKGFRRFRLPIITNVTLHLSEVVSGVKGKVIDVRALKHAGLIRNPSKRFQVKVVFDKEIDRQIEVRGDISVTTKAKAAIEKAGGSVA